jgi:hypothetical protein
MGRELWNSWISGHFLLRSGFIRLLNLLQWLPFFPEALAGHTRIVIPTGLRPT